MAVKNQNLLELVVNNNLQLPIANKMLLTLNIMNFVPPRQLNVPYTNFYKPGTPEWKFKFNSDLNKVTSDWDLYKKKFFNDKSNNSSLNKVVSTGVDVATDIFSDKLSNEIFGDSELGRGLGTLFSSGVSSAGNTIADNLLKGNILTQGLSKNVGTSLAGAGVGLLSQGIGKGINSIGGDSMLSRGIGLGVATGLGTIGGKLLTNGTSNLFGSANSIFSAVDKMKKAKDATEAANFASKASAINPYALGAQVVGSALGAALGPSKEYGGRYGNVTRTLDTIYDTASAAVNFIPGAGQFISAGMALNKGLSNLFGSTDGMTVLDAVLGSAFMPAPVKWLNMAGSSKTGTFNNLSWLNTEKADSFMQDAFGNLSDRFDKARAEAGKTYGTFSQGARRRALSNINFANYAWGEILDMANLNNYQNIRSLDMASINNLRYAQNIQGGWSPLAIGRQGMKILNNATNHNIGMRLLSGAALIDNKQMILSALGGTKVTRPKMKPHRKGEQPVYTEEELKQQAEWNAHLEEVRKQQIEELARRLKLREEAAAKFNLQANLVLTAMTLQANETPFTGQEYQQAAEDLRLEKVEKFHEAEKVGEAALMADLAVSTAPLLLRGFRWAFNKAGLLVKISKNSSKGFNFNDLPQEKYIYNKKTGEFDIIAPKKEWVQKGENELVPDYFVSPEELQRLIASGLSPEEAAEIMQTRFINSINARPGIFRNLGKNTYGESRISEGYAQPVYNNRKGVKASLNDAKTTLNTVFHELGGHGSSLNGELSSFKFDNPLVKIMMHNEKLRPQLKPFYQAVKNGDFKLAEKLAPKDGSLKGTAGTYNFKELQKFIKYMEENLEYSARAIGTNMSNHYGMPNGWNEQLLREYFTEESVNKLLKNVWNYNIPITAGGSTAATLYNKSK